MSGWSNPILGRMRFAQPEPFDLVVEEERRRREEEEKRAQAERWARLNRQIQQMESEKAKEDSLVDLAVTSQKQEEARQAREARLDEMREQTPTDLFRQRMAEVSPAYRKGPAAHMVDQLLRAAGGGPKWRPLDERIREESEKEYQLQTTRMQAVANQERLNDALLKQQQMAAQFQAELGRKQQEVALKASLAIRGQELISKHRDAMLAISQGRLDVLKDNLKLQEDWKKSQALGPKNRFMERAMQAASLVAQDKLDKDPSYQPVLDPMTGNPAWNPRDPDMVRALDSLLQADDLMEAGIKAISRVPSGGSTTVSETENIGFGKRTTSRRIPGTANTQGIAKFLFDQAEAQRRAAGATAIGAVAPALPTPLGVAAGAARTAAAPGATPRQIVRRQASATPTSYVTLAEVPDADPKVSDLLRVPKSDMVLDSRNRWRGATRGPAYDPKEQVTRQQMFNQAMAGRDILTQVSNEIASDYVSGNMRYLHTTGVKPIDALLNQSDTVRGWRTWMTEGKGLTNWQKVFTPGHQGMVDFMTQTGGKQLTGSEQELIRKWWPKAFATEKDTVRGFLGISYLMGLKSFRNEMGFKEGRTPWLSDDLEDYLDSAVNRLEELRSQGKTDQAAELIRRLSDTEQYYSDKVRAYDWGRASEEEARKRGAEIQGGRTPKKKAYRWNGSRMVEVQ